MTEAIKRMLLERVRDAKAKHDVILVCESLGIENCEAESY